MKRLTVVCGLLLGAGVAQAQSTHGFLPKVPAACLKSLDQDFVFTTGESADGQDTVLYYEESNLEWQDQYAKVLPQFLASVGDMQKRLAQKGIQLTMVPIPSRGAFLSLGADPNSQQVHRAAYNQMITGLKGAGVKTVDAQQVLSGVKDPVFRLEAHWTVPGGQAVAQAIAKTLGPVRPVDTVTVPAIRNRELIPVARQVANRCHIDWPEVTYNDAVFPDAQGRLYASSGFTVPETNVGGTMIWTLGPEATFSFKSDGQPTKLSASLYSPVPGEKIQVLLNDRPLTQTTYPKVGVYKINQAVTPQRGLNKLTFKVSAWNHGTVSFAPKDDRIIGVAFTQLSLAKPAIDLLKSPQSVPEWSQSLTDDGLSNVLVGTSYSEEDRVSDLRFPNFIRAYTGKDMANFALGGGGIASAFRDFLENDQFSGGATKQLIWEYPYLDTLQAQPNIEQLDAAVKFKVCARPQALRVDAAGQLANWPAGSVLRLESADKSVSDVKLTHGTEETELRNNDRQATKNIFYFDTAKLGAGESVKVPANLASKMTVQACK